MSLIRYEIKFYKIRTMEWPAMFKRQEKRTHLPSHLFPIFPFLSSICFWDQHPVPFWNTMIWNAPSCCCSLHLGKDISNGQLHIQTKFWTSVIRLESCFCDVSHKKAKMRFFKFWLNMVANVSPLFKHSCYSQFITRYDRTANIWSDQLLWHPLALPIVWRFCRLAGK